MTDSLLYLGDVCIIRSWLVRGEIKSFSVVTLARTHTCTHMHMQPGGDVAEPVGADPAAHPAGAIAGDGVRCRCGG